MSIVFTSAEILEALKTYAVNEMNVPDEVAEKITLQRLNSVGEYEEVDDSQEEVDDSQVVHGLTIRGVVRFETEDYSQGPYR